ncbi:Glyoxylase, beta-lactamase superfamily II [Sphingomonas palmae]|uniref:Glyoxylase, beta-lactamase superfamily II n=1 Tax=Sphingomonas palmae TaxID=1855283 RepID=A0A1H7TZJ8_9SPHN|nr:MBL fold metallo-hydrolase [Sphingomonas palmae]SEL89397.1 Glyoxylase, beta-lactamase superfamily II [Sphingomonas palmae]
MIRPLASLALGAAFAAVAVSAAPRVAGAAATTFRVGGVEVVSLRDAVNVVPNDGKTFGLGHSPTEVAQVLRKRGAPADPITLGVDQLLVRLPGRLVLIDTGLGPKVGGTLMQSLSQAGVAPDQIADVLITHGHPDHVGGLVDVNGKPAFPKAVVHLSAPEWQSIQQGRGADVVPAIKAQVKTFAPGAAILPGITAVALFGHTPGHSGYRITSGKQSLLVIGDLAHSAVVSLARPMWPIQYDGDKPQGEQTRVRELAQLAATHQRIFAGHFPYPGVGYVVRSGEGYAFQPERR